MFQIKGLNISHKRDLRNMLEDFSLVLNPGDKAVIIGEEGNGKSTLLRWMYDPDAVGDYIEAHGERIVSSERLGYLPQELSKEDKKKTVYEFFSESEMFYLKTPGELAQLSAEMQIDKDCYYSDQLMESLSGGEKIKIQMLKLLIQEPTVLLLDEPSNDIDIETLEWLEKFISDAKEAILFVSHDELLIEHTANMVIHIEQLKRKRVCRHTVIRMPYTQYVAYRNSNMRNQAALAVSQRKEQKIKEKKLRRIQQKVEHDQASVTRQDPHSGRLLKKKMHVVKAMEHRFEREKQNMAEMPESESAMFLKMGSEKSAVPSGKTVIDFSLPFLMCPDGSRALSTDIHLFLRGDEKICITGKNGCGKTTLIREIAKELLPRDDIRAEYMPQNYLDLLDENQSPVDFLAPGGKKEDTTRVRTYLGSMKYTAEEMDHCIADLSGGQKAKILLLKMSLSDANVLILDEPTRNFSPLSGPVIRNLLHTFPGAIISVSHDRKYIEEVCDKTYVLTEYGLTPGIR